jgi:hypothetical protein
MTRLWLWTWLVMLSGCAAWLPPAPQALDHPLTTAECTALVQDLVAGLPPAFAPAQTHLHVLAAASADTLAAPLAQALRDAGYGVASQAEKGAVPLRVQLHAPVEAQLLVRLDVGDTYQWTRLYKRLGQGGLDPLSGPTVRRE